MRKTKHMLVAINGRVAQVEATLLVLGDAVDRYVLRINVSRTFILVPW
jgi:hypothetical protein